MRRGHWRGKESGTPRMTHVKSLTKEGEGESDKRIVEGGNTIYTTVKSDIMAGRLPGKD